MAAGLLEPLVAFRKEWGILVLVLMSFTLQVILLITAEIRRRMDSGVLKVVVWSAYLLADTTAIYALGHMSLTSQEQHLMAFWAPFLLLHLGGQDNITAYSIEDNRLWLRHLQSFVIQAFAAAYVLYQSSIVTCWTLLRPATILIFVVGVVKYVERVCALNLSSSGTDLSVMNYRDFDKLILDGSVLGEYSQTYRAHILLDIPKHVLKGPLLVRNCKDTSSNWEYMYGVAEMQLSLMHDVFYSKAELIHTWYGYCIRVFSLLATVAALQLFRRFSEKDGYRRADVAATYVLLAGAVILEITSVLRVMFSSWTYTKLIRARHSCVSYALARRFLRFHAMCRGAIKYWSGSMGQLNFIYMCIHSKHSRGSKIARWMGRGEWWNMLVYTSSVPVSPNISQLLKKQIKESKDVDHESPDHILNSRGRAALKRSPGLYEELGWSVDTDLNKSIFVWHIATHVYLSWYEAEHVGRPHHLARVTQELSNYMMFLLAARPYMLPDNARQTYLPLFKDMMYEVQCSRSSEANLLSLIRCRGDAINASRVEDIAPTNLAFDGVCRLSDKLIRKELETPNANMLELISQVWVELLCYAAHGCSPDSHARQLSNGGELTTVVTIMLEYMERGVSIFREGEQLEDTTAPGKEGV